VAAVLVRTVGEFLLVPDTLLVLGGLCLVTVPAMAVVALGLYRLYGVAWSDRPRVVVLLVLPVAAPDAVALLLYWTLFPTSLPGAPGCSPSGCWSLTPAFRSQQSDADPRDGR
jgi:hypothetical protein